MKAAVGTMTAGRVNKIPAPIFTELDAIRLLTGAEAKLLAGGGVYGAEGASWLMLVGTDEQVAAAEGDVVEILESR